MEQEKEKKKQPFGGMELSERMRRGLKRGGIEWVTIELEKREQNTLGENIDLVKRLEGIFAHEKAIELEKMNKLKEEARLKREAEEAEAQAKAKAAARAKRKDDALRKAEIREMREDAAEEEAEERLIEDRRGMVNEDKASAFQEQKYRLELNLLEAGKKAKGFIEELRDGREKEQKMDKMIANSKQRAEKREQRNRRMEELKARYKKQELHLDGDVLGYGLEADIDSLEEMVEGCSRLRKDMHEIRTRKSNTMIRHEAAVKKRNQFESKCRAIDKKIRDCRRAIRDTVRAIDDANKRGRRLPNSRRITAKGVQEATRTTRSRKNRIKRPPNRVRTRGTRLESTTKCCKGRNVCYCRLCSAHDYSSENERKGFRRGNRKIRELEKSFGN